MTNFKFINNIPFKVTNAVIELRNQSFQSIYNLSIVYFLVRQAYQNEGSKLIHIIMFINAIFINAIVQIKRKFQTQID